MREEVPDLYEVLGVERWVRKTLRLATRSGPDSIGADQSLIEVQYRRKQQAAYASRVDRSGATTYGAINPAAGEAVSP